MEKAGMYVRLFFKENTTGSVRCGRGESKDTAGYTDFVDVSQHT